jgi:hypothetical protein
MAVIESTSNIWWPKVDKMENQIDHISRELAQGLSRRDALLKLGRAFAASVLFSIGFRKTAAVSCFAMCEAKCTAPDGTLDLVCFRKCVNSDPNNCGSCGNKCLPNTTCVNGKCSGPANCSSDSPTIESLTAAKTQIATGANEVALSPGGCYRYGRSTSGGAETQEILFNGATVLSFRNTATQLTGQINSTSTSRLLWNLQRGATPNDFTSVQSHYNPSSGMILSRTSTVATGGSYQVTEEKADQSGNLLVVAQYEATVDDFDHANQVPSATGQVAASSFGCSIGEEQRLSAAYDHAVGVGLECFKHYQASNDVLLMMMFNYTARDVLFLCDPTLNANGRADRNAINDPSKPITISVSDPLTFNLDDRDLSAVLFHEFLHFQFGPHSPYLQNSNRRKEFDRTYACESLCFGMSDSPQGGNSNPTKCTCASCLQTNVCDPRCKLEPDCNPTFFICPCPTGKNAFKQFSDCTTCLVNCPSGLACFGFSTCMVFDVSCNAPVTCP